LRFISILNLRVERLQVGEKLFNLKITIFGKSKGCQSELRKRNSKRYAKIDDVIGCLLEGSECSYLSRTTSF
jgi:hypothetical protein